MLTCVLRHANISVCLTSKVLVKENGHRQFKAFYALMISNICVHLANKEKTERSMSVKDKTRNFSLHENE